MTDAKLIFSREDKKIYRDGDKLVKVFDKKYSKANILNEALNHARVEETDLNVPKIRSIGVVDGNWAIVLDYIEGETLQSLMTKHPEKQDEYLELFVDLQMTVLSNSSADVARSYLLFYLAGEEELANKYLKLYCKKSDTAIQYVQRWIPIVAAARLSKSKPEEEQFLRGWIDVVDYE